METNGDQATISSVYRIGWFGSNKKENQKSVKDCCKGELVQSMEMKMLKLKKCF